MNLNFQICDSTLTKMCEHACQGSNIVENATNNGNPEITTIVCGMLIHIAIIIVGGLLIWQVIKLISNGIKSCSENKRAKEAKEFEVRCTYRTKALDYLEGKTISKDDAYIIALNRFLDNELEDIVKPHTASKTDGK